VKALLRPGVALCLAAALLGTAGCGGSATPARHPSKLATPSPVHATSTANPPTRVPGMSTANPTGGPGMTTVNPKRVPARSTSNPASRRSPAPPTSPLRTHRAPRPAHQAPISNRNRPVIVIDPGHSVAIHAVDPGTGLDVSDYENEPEMRDVFAVAEIVRANLVKAGYRVIMTKPAVDTPTSLGRRAEIANAAHAALALSVHDQAGASGGVGVGQGNNVVYYQSVGRYRETPAGKKVYFADAAVAARSKMCGMAFQRARAEAQHAPVTLLGDTGYDLGTRGLPPGNIWLVQLLSHVPWIYNEAGGNSTGMIGLDRADEQRYAAGLVAGVEACVPIDH